MPGMTLKYCQFVSERKNALGDNSRSALIEIRCANEFYNAARRSQELMLCSRNGSCSAGCQLVTSC